MYPLISSPFSVNCFSRLLCSLILSWALLSSFLILHLNLVLLHVSIDLFPLLSQLLFQASNQFSHLVPVVHKSRHNFFHSALNQDTSHHPEALSIAINPVESLNDNVMLIEILL